MPSHKARRGRRSTTSQSSMRQLGLTWASIVEETGQHNAEEETTGSKYTGRNAHTSSR